MSKRLLLLFFVMLTVTLLPGSVSAHVLIKDTVSGTGAILHVNPDDDPIAGERAVLFFDIRDASISSASSQARLTITDDQGTAAAVAYKLLGSSVSANYTFPRQGLYTIRLVIEQGNKVTHVFVQNQRVSRGVIETTTITTTHPWAEDGLLFAALGVVTLAIVAFNKRDSIKEYSKW